MASWPALRPGSMLTLVIVLITLVARQVAWAQANHGDAFGLDADLVGDGDLSGLPFAKDPLFGTRVDRSMDPDAAYYAAIEEAMSNNTDRYSEFGFSQNATYRGGPVGQGGVMHVQYDATVSPNLVNIDFVDDVIDAYCAIADGFLWLHVMNETSTVRAWKPGTFK